MTKLTKIKTNSVYGEFAMCVNCSDYELCLQDNNKCYQYLEEEQRLNVGKKKRPIKRTNNKDL